MRIRTQFTITMLLFGILLVIIAASAIITNHQVEKASKQEKIASSIAQGASELSYLSNDYLIYRESQQLKRWQSRFASFSAQVAGLRADRPEQQALVRNIQANAQRIKEVFDSVASAVGGSSQNRSTALDLAFLQVSWSRMAVQSQGLVADASRLSQLLHQQMDQLTNTRTVLIYFMVGLFGAFLLASYMLTYRRILKSIATLQASAAVIGSGNLEFTIEEKKNDEIGDLSNAFNRMTTDLKAVTASKADLEREITERKRTEDAVRTSLERYRSYIEVTGGLGWTTNADGEVVEDIPSFRKFTGETDEETKGWGWSKALHPDDLEHTTQIWRQAVKSKSNYEVEYRLRRHDGIYRYFLARGTPVFEGNGSIREWIGTCIDITERKQMEEDLRKSRQELEIRVQERTADLAKANELLERMFSSTGIMIAYMDKDFNFIRVNRAYAKADEREPEFYVGRNHFVLFPNEENEQIFRKVVETGEPYSVYAKPFEYAEHPERGVTHWDWSLQPVKEPDGSVGGVVLSLVNVTDRIRAQEAVETERQRFNDVLEILPAYLVLLAPDYHVPFANRFFRERFGESQGQRCFEYLFGRSEPCETCESYTALKTMAPHKWEWTGPDGRNYDVFDFPFTDTDGSTLILEMGIDITERKQAQEALNAVSLYTRSLIEASLDPLVTISPDGKVTDVNKATELVTGATREDLIGTDFSNYFTDPEKAQQGYRQVFSEGFVKDYPLSIRHPSGKVTDVLYNATIYRNEVGEIQGVFAAARDVTELKQTQDALRTASLYTRSLIEASLDPLVTISADGKIMDVNRATELTTGVSRDELIGTDFWDYFTEPEKAREGYQRVFREGFVRDYPLAIRHTSGKVTDVLYHATVYRNEAGEIQGVFAAARDITERKRMEEELRKSENRLRLLSSQLLTVQEAERKRIAREIHDSIGQTLAAIKFGLESKLSQMGGGTAPLGVSIENIISLTQNGIEESRRIQMDLRPSILDDLGILATIGWFTREFQKVYAHISVEKQISAQENEIPDSLKTTIFRVMQEAMNNIAKHSKANLARLILKKTVDKIELSIEDNGAGFDPENPKQGLGLTSMRERAELSGGALFIESTVGKGTMIKASWPI